MEFLQAEALKTDEKLAMGDRSFFTVIMPSKNPLLKQRRT
jgi:hypothetical protein